MSQTWMLKTDKEQQKYMPVLLLSRTEKWWDLALDSVA